VVPVYNRFELRHIAGSANRPASKAAPTGTATDGSAPRKSPRRLLILVLELFQLSSFHHGEFRKAQGRHSPSVCVDPAIEARRFFFHRGQWGVCFTVGVGHRVKTGWSIR